MLYDEHTEINDYVIFGGFLVSESLKKEFVSEKQVILKQDEINTAVNMTQEKIKGSGY